MNRTLPVVASILACVPNANAADLYWNSGRTAIVAANGDGSCAIDAARLIPGNAPELFVVDPVTGTMYGSPNQGSIYRIPYGGTEATRILATRLVSVIAADFPSGHLYFATGSGNYKIVRCNLNGTGVQDLVTETMVPSALAIDPIERKLYWVDAWTQRIQRSNLDGTNIEDVIYEGIGQPFALDIDWEARRMYWSDRAGPDHVVFRIRSANLDGTDIETVIPNTGSIAYTIALDVPQQALYWSVQYAPVPNVSRLDLRTGDVSPILPFDVLTLTHTVTVARCHGFLRTDPPDGSIDARAISGWNAIDFRFDERLLPSPATDVEVVGVDDWTATLTAPGVLRVEFSKPITPGSWVCARHTETGARACIGHQPGDVDGDGTSSARDILAVVDCLNSGACELSQCDLDGSGTCTPRDILGVVDALNGAGGRVPQLGRSLPECP